MVNSDAWRFKSGESPSQQTLLRRCKNLKTPRTVVDHPDMFLWAVGQLEGGTAQSHEENTLNRLQKLFLLMRTERGAANNPMIAFGWFPQTIYIRNLRS